MTYTATIKFETRTKANEFASAWSRKSFMGHKIDDTAVTVYKVTESLKSWIDAYAFKMNAGV